MSEYKKEKETPKEDAKFKAFAHLINQCKHVDEKGRKCNHTGYIVEHIRDEHGLISKSVAKECECVKNIYKYALYKEANIPAEYWDLSMNDFFKKEETVEARDFVEKKIIPNIKIFSTSGYGIFFHGGPGTGKTMLGVEILKEFLKKDMTGYYDWFPSITKLFMNKSFELDEKRNEYTKIFETRDVLVLDELGKESQDGFGFKKTDVARFLEIEILKKRSNKTTILISNLENVEDVGTHYNVYVESFIRQKFKTKQLVGSDFRTQGSINNFFDNLESEGENNE